MVKNKKVDTKEADNKLLIDKEQFDLYFKADRKTNFINYDINVFQDLRQLRENKLIKNSYHQAFTFGYLWVISYMWKYSKYGQIQIDTGHIKALLGLNPKEKKVNYIIKKDGLLDMIAWTETTRNFPMETKFPSEGEDIQVTQLSHLDDEIAKSFLDQYSNKYCCKLPVLQYERSEKEGLMFTKDDVLPVSVFEFARIVLSKDLGIDAFEVYCFIKLKSKLAKKSAIVIYQREMINMLGYSKPRIKTLTRKLAEANMITIEKVKTTGWEKCKYEITKKEFW